MLRIQPAAPGPRSNPIACPKTLCGRPQTALTRTTNLLDHRLLRVRPAQVAIEIGIEICIGIHLVVISIYRRFNQCLQGVQARFEVGGIEIGVLQVADFG